MSTKDDFDYVDHYHEHSPDPSKLTNSVKARAQRAAAAKQRITIRLDQDVLDEFKALAEAEGGTYQTLINLALREWLTAKDVRELLRRELPGVVREALEDKDRRSA